MQTRARTVIDSECILIAQRKWIFFFYAMLLINLINKCSTHFSADIHIYLTILSSFLQTFAFFIYLKGKADLGFGMEKICSISNAHSYLQRRYLNTCPVLNQNNIMYIIHIPHYCSVFVSSSAIWHIRVTSPNVWWKCLHWSNWISGEY